MGGSHQKRSTPQLRDHHPDQAPGKVFLRRGSGSSSVVVCTVGGLRPTLSAQDALRVRGVLLSVRRASSGRKPASADSTNGDQTTDKTAQGAMVEATGHSFVTLFAAGGHCPSEQDTEDSLRPPILRAAAARHLPQMRDFSPQVMGLRRARRKQA